LLQNLNPAGNTFNIGGTRNQNMRDAKYFENTWINTHVYYENWKCLMKERSLF
jgi:hypothetical protein